MSKTVKISLIVLAVLAVIAGICLYSKYASDNMAATPVVTVDPDLLASSTDSSDEAIDADMVKTAGQLDALDIASTDVDESLK